jgi:TonB family protein
VPPAPDSLPSSANTTVAPGDYKAQLDSYLRDLAQASVVNITYPEEARQEQWTGTASIALRVDPGGELKESYVDTSSGYASLDVVALLAVRKALADMPPTALLKSRGFVGKIAIHFELSPPNQR